MFKKLFRGGSVSPKIEGNVSARGDRSHLDASAWERNDRLPSFLTVPTENVTVLSSRRPSSEISLDGGVSKLNVPSMMISKCESLEVRPSSEIFVEDGVSNLNAPSLMITKCESLQVRPSSEISVEGGVTNLNAPSMMITKCESLEVSQAFVTKVKSENTI